MRDRLAEQLLAKVLHWKAEEVAQERPLVQALAAFKYDEYEQFSAGSRFIESLALWLNQFDTTEERRTAYDFVKTRLVYCSAAELRHLVEMAYPDFVMPLLIERAAVSSGMSRYMPLEIAGTKDFRIRRRQCLFLGLSDGSRIDVFRRANSRSLDHEQIWQTYELSEERVDKLLSKLREHLQTILGRQPTAAETRFNTLVLLDDFSASGTSYYGLPATAPVGGKITGLFEELVGNRPASRLVNLGSLEVFIVLYMATQQAISHLEAASEAVWNKRGVSCTVKVVQQLPKNLQLVPTGTEGIHSLIQHPKYYDHSIHDSHFRKGGTADARYGYAGCGLPLVLHHNTPNNSISLIMSYEEKEFRGLFPRIQRHRETS